MPIRVMTARDYVKAAAIDAESDEPSWTQDDFSTRLKEKGIFGIVYEEENALIGFAVYENDRNLTRLINIGVLPKHRRHSIGTQLFSYLTAKLTKQRSRIIFDVRERNLAAQLFFRAQGCIATAILPKFYPDTPEDAYSFKYIKPIT